MTSRIIIIALVIGCSAAHANERRPADNHTRLTRWGLAVLPKAQAQQTIDSQPAKTPPGYEFIATADSIEKPNPLPTTTANNKINYDGSLSNSLSARRLRTRINKLLRSHPIGRVKLGIVIADAENGMEWVSKNASVLLNPASTLKLFTSAVALSRLGPSYQFVTELLVKGSTVYLRGTGDPWLETKNLDQFVARIAPRLQQVEKIVVDASAFAGGVLPPGFGAKNTDAAYRASSGAVALDFGAVVVEVRPSREGRPPHVAVRPPGKYLIINNRAKTVVGKGSTIRTKLRRKGNRSIAEITGKIGRKQRKPSWVRRRIEHPPLAAGYALRAMLKRQGLNVEGSVTLGKTPSDAQRLGTMKSKPLIKLISGMNKESNNFIAETLLRGFVQPHQGPANWSQGQTIVRQWLTANLGLDASSYSFNNASGLYNGGRFSARQVAKLLVAMNKHQYRRDYRKSLSVAGSDGTLAKRLGGSRYKGRMVGKTGTLNKVSALSGYALNRNGKRLAFSILMNNTGGATKLMRKVQDQIVALIIDSR